VPADDRPVEGEGALGVRRGGLRVPVQRVDQGALGQMFGAMRGKSK